jgi:hypothetical protein
VLPHYYVWIGERQHQDFLITKSYTCSMDTLLAIVDIICNVNKPKIMLQIWNKNHFGWNGTICMFVFWSYKWVIYAYWLAKQVTLTLIVSLKCVKIVNNPFCIMTTLLPSHSRNAQYVK